MVSSLLHYLLNFIYGLIQNQIFLKAVLALFWAYGSQLQFEFKILPQKRRDIECGVVVVPFYFITDMQHAGGKMFSLKIGNEVLDTYSSRGLKTLCISQACSYYDIIYDYLIANYVTG